MVSIRPGIYIAGGGRYGSFNKGLDLHFDWRVCTEGPPCWARQGDSLWCIIQQHCVQHFLQEIVSPITEGFLPPKGFNMSAKVHVIIKLIQSNLRNSLFNVSPRHQHPRHFIVPYEPRVRYGWGRCILRVWWRKACHIYLKQCWFRRNILYSIESSPPYKEQLC